MDALGNVVAAQQEERSDKGSGADGDATVVGQAPSDLRGRQRHERDRACDRGDDRDGGDPHDDEQDASGLGPDAQRGREVIPHLQQMHPLGEHRGEDCDEEDGHGGEADVAPGQTVEGSCSPDRDAHGVLHLRAQDDPGVDR